MNKRGIAPVVSTVILLVFATGLGLVVMNWGNAVSIEEEQEGCRASLELVVVDGAPQACVAEQTIKLVLENNGLENIEALKVSLIDEQGIVNQEIPLQLQFVEIKDVEIVFERQITGVKKMKLTPKTSEYCPEKAVEIETIGVCP